MTFYFDRSYLENGKTFTLADFSEGLGFENFSKFFKKKSLASWTLGCLELHKFHYFSEKIFQSPKNSISSGARTLMLIGQIFPTTTSIRSTKQTVLKMNGFRVIGLCRFFGLSPTGQGPHFLTGPVARSWNSTMNCTPANTDSRKEA